MPTGWFLRPALRRVVAASVIVTVPVIVPLRAAAQEPPAVPPTVSLDVVVTDRDGRAPDRLGPNEIVVTVDGKARRVVSVRRVSRGPGAASDAAARLAGADSGAGAGSFASEPSRSFVVVIDEAGVVRGQERQALTASRAFLDRLGMADRIAALVLPLTGSQLLSLTTDQPAVRAALAGVTGRVLPSVQVRPQPAVTAPEPGPGSNDEREPPPQPLPTDQPAIPALDMTQAGVHGSLDGLAGIIDAMRAVPGRKTVALFSAGAVNLSLAQVNSLAASALAARTAVYVFGLGGAFDAAESGLDARPLESLAQLTGGRFVALGRNADRAIGRVVAEMSSCYVVDVEGALEDGDARRRTLKVSVAGRGWTARAAAWLVPAPDAGDVPATRPETGDEDAPAGETPSGDTSEPSREEARAKPARVSAASAARAAELQLATGRLFDYVDAYERQYSGLVAEEEYRQSTRAGGRKRLRSDYLLVKLERAPGWESFRDVFDVDGTAVRDRDDRLRRLFLEPSLLIEGQLAAIKNESARHNIGAVERNINVPLFTLRFLSPENRGRFQFRLSGTRRVGDVEVWRLEYEETARPTIISDLHRKDVPAKGWFLVDQTTGAIVESGLRAAEEDSSAEIRVAFRLDPDLGMRVPERMSETYRAVVAASGRGLPRVETVQEGTALYSRFRRFVVKTEETITVPK